jgi:DNA primase catalytic subunit
LLTSFNHSEFSEPSYVPPLKSALQRSVSHFARKQSLFNIEEPTISAYSKLEHLNVTLVIQYLNSDYERVLPKFTSILNVPFIFMSEVANEEFHIPQEDCLKLR